MKQSRKSILLAALLLCCAFGCGTEDFPIYYDSFGNNELEIDGVHYRHSGGYVRVGKKKKFVGSIVAVYPKEQNPSPKVIVNNGKAEAVVFFDEKPVEVDIDTIYYIDENKIVSSKSMREAEFEYDDSARSFPEEKLQPILETMIRENLPKDE